MREDQRPHTLREGARVGLLREGRGALLARLAGSLWYKGGGRKGCRRKSMTLRALPGIFLTLLSFMSILYRHTGTQVAIGGRRVNSCPKTCGHHSGQRVSARAYMHISLDLNRVEAILDAGLDLLLGESVGGVEEVRDVDARLLDLGAEVVVALDEPVVQLELRKGLYICVGGCLRRNQVRGVHCAGVCKCARRHPRSTAMSLQLKLR